MAVMPTANMIQAALRGAARPFSDFVKASVAIWWVIGAFVIDSIAYFGMLTLMTTYLGHDLGWGDAWAATAVTSAPSGASTSAMCFRSRT
jgi:hypothetical protein